MAKLVGVFAASHGPMIAREWDTLTPPTRAAVTDGFERTGKRLMATQAGRAGDRVAGPLVQLLPQQLPGVLRRHRRGARRAAGAVPEASLQPSGAGRPCRPRPPHHGHRAGARLRSVDVASADARSRLLPAAVADGHRPDPADRADRHQRGRRSDADDAALPRLGHDAEAGDRELSARICASRCWRPAA